MSLPPAARLTFFNSVLGYVRKVLMPGLQRRMKAWIGGNSFGISYWDLARLRLVPRFRRAHFPLLGHQIELTDSAGCWHCIHELLIQESYLFHADRPNPRIIDCGANIGLSIIYFKHLYPEAEIIAFEPDAEIFDALEKNMRTFGFAGVTLHRKAVWNAAGDLPFMPDGGFGGRVETGATGELPTVPAIRLRDYLSDRVDFLKIDIEGAEGVVMEDCKDHLEKVDRLFVEYHGQKNQAQQLGELLLVLQRADFRYVLKEAAPTTHPFLRKTEDAVYDLQLNIFAYRE